MSKKSKAYKKGMFNNNFEFIDSAVLNDSIFMHYEEMFREIVLSMFEWVNLPKSMDSRWLEKCLYYNGMAGLHKDEKMGLINTNVASSGKLNIYGLPTELNCFSFEYQKIKNLYTGLTGMNDKDKDLQKLNDVVLVLNNWEKIPTAGQMALFCLKLYECDSTALTNIKAQKTPVLILAPEEKRLTMENLYSQYNGNRPFIFGNDETLDGTSIQSIRTEAPFVADKIQDYKKEILNDALTFLGINNIMVEKKERLTDDEANSNNEFINLNLQSRLAPRQEACKQFNELYGTNIEVRVRSDLHNVIKNQLSTISDLINKNDLSKNEKEVNEKEVTD